MADFVNPFPDLFPETLLVSIEGGHTQTDSLKVAAHFHKRHDHVMRDIEKLLKKYAKAGISPPNFGESDYQNTRGKVFKMYTMDRKAFCMLASTFTGLKALVWQDQYHTAFENMDAQLRAIEARYAAALDLVRPTLRPVVEGTQAGLSRAAIAGPLGKSCGSITYHRGQGKRLGLLLAGGAA